MTKERIINLQEKIFVDKLARIDPTIPLTAEQISTLQADFAHMQEVFDSTRGDISGETNFKIAKYFGLSYHALESHQRIFEKISENYGRLKSYVFDSIWFSHDWYREEDFDRQFYPHYYLELKQNPTLVKPYIKKLLQQGRYSRSLHNENDETNPASFVNFLHLGTNDTEFVTGLEEAIIDILQEASSFQITKFDTNSPPRKRYDAEDPSYIFRYGKIAYLLERLALDTPTLSREQRILKAKILFQVTQKEREMTLEERFGWLGNPFTSHREKYQAIYDHEPKPMHCSLEMSQEFRLELLDYFDKYFNVEIYGVMANPKLNALVACLEIIIMRGRKTNGLSRTRGTLMQLSQSPLVKDTESFELNYHPVNLAQLVERALIAISN